MGFVSGLPVGVSFIGPAWSEAKLLSLGYAFEQATRARQDPPFLPSLAAPPGDRPGLRPAAVNFTYYKCRFSVRSSRT